MTERATANQSAFYVYENADSAFNRGFPSGFFGAFTKLKLDAACVADPLAPGGCSTDPTALDRDRGNVMQVTFDPLNLGEFTGLNIEEPEGWGATPTGRGYDLRGVTELVFEIANPTPAGINLQFGVAGATAAFMHIAPSDTFTTISISLATMGLIDSDLSDVHILFSVAANDMNTPIGGTVLIDNIRLEPIPASHEGTLALPSSTQTFGVIPLQFESGGRVAFPPDQVNRRLAAIYESSSVLIALLARGTEADLVNAHLIADTLSYAMRHDNQGAPLPVAPSGATGLHSAYEAGDIALLNSQGSGAGQEGHVREAGFSAELCAPSNFCLVLDGATGGNVSFAVLALVAAYEEFQDVSYLEGARNLGVWIVELLEDTSAAGFGGYFLGYPDEGIQPKILIEGKTTENNADIFAAFRGLARVERALGNMGDAAFWTQRANVAGDFVLAMYDANSACFSAGTVPIGTAEGPGIEPFGAVQGDDVINTAQFLDANSFPIMALAPSRRYGDAIDWNGPARCMLDQFSQRVTAAGRTFMGASIVPTPTEGPSGIAWEFTGQLAAALAVVDRQSRQRMFRRDIRRLLRNMVDAQQFAPFGDGKGIVASTLRDGDRIPPYEHCLSTPFQCIPQRVGLAATVWGIFAERNINPFSPLR